jgi:hypothetical protein
VDKLTGKVLPKLEDKNNNVIDALRYACEGARRAKAQKPKRDAAKSAERDDVLPTGGTGMDGLRVACGMVAAHKFFFWTRRRALASTARDLLAQGGEPRAAGAQAAPAEGPVRQRLRALRLRPALDAGSGTGARRTRSPGMPAAETYAWREQWDGIPFHEVEFSDMPQITFKVRAVSSTGAAST